MTNFLSKLSSREKKIFSFCVLIVIAFLFDRLCVNPTLKQIDKTSIKISNEEERIRADLQYLDNRDQIMKESKSYEGFITKDLKGKNEINKELLGSLEKLSEKAHIVSKINPGEMLDEDTHIKYYLNLDCSGELKDMVSFMHLLNSTNDLFKVVRFSLTSKRGESDQVTASMTIVKLILKQGVN